MNLKKISLFCVFSLVLIGTVFAVEANVGGKLAPDNKTEINIDLPGTLHLQNKGGSDGAGLCVFTSISHAAHWQNIPVLQDFRDWMTRYPGGSWPEKTDEKIKQICSERGVPLPEYIQIEGKRETLPILKAAITTNRMVSVTYNYSPTGRYNGRRIAHMVNLVHMDDKYACILDNNYPGDNKYEWMTVEQFYGVFADRGNGWAVILLNSGPPPLPNN